MSYPTISVVTPSLNQAAFLGEALRSVHTQTYPAHEHLVFDGGSADGTQNLLATFLDTTPGARLIWQSRKDKGQSDALNQGFAQAAGDIIGWLNADDRYRPDCLHHVAQTFAQHPEIDILYGDYTFIDRTGNHIGLRREIEFSRFVLRYHRVLYIPTTSTFFRRRIFRDQNFLRTDLHYAMDADFFMRLADTGYRFHHLPRVLADFRIHPASKSTRFLEEQKQEHRRAVLSATPLGRRVAHTPLSNTVVRFLQILAAFLRHGEKLLRGFYFPEMLTQKQSRKAVSR